MCGFRCLFLQCHLQLIASAAYLGERSYIALQIVSMAHAVIYSMVGWDYWRVKASQPTRETSTIPFLGILIKTRVLVDTMIQIRLSCM